MPPRLSQFLTQSDHLVAERLNGGARVPVQGRQVETQNVDQRAPPVRLHREAVICHFAEYGQSEALWSEFSQQAAVDEAGRLHMVRGFRQRGSHGDKRFPQGWHHHGSQSDWPVMKEAARLLGELGVPYEARIVSAHRTPDRLVSYAKEAKARGLKVIIAGAGGRRTCPA